VGSYGTSGKKEAEGNETRSSATIRDGVSKSVKPLLGVGRYGKQLIGKKARVCKYGKLEANKKKKEEIIFKKSKKKRKEGHRTKLIP